MKEKSEYLQDIRTIKDMMNKSTRFISLSGLSGILTGIYALISAFIAYKYFYGNTFDYKEMVSNFDGFHQIPLLFLGLGTIVLSIGTGLILSLKKAKKMGLSFFDKTAKQLFFHLAIPLITGGIVCLILLFLRDPNSLINSMTLIFYGLALVNASKYTYNDVLYLGICEIVLGIISLFWIGLGLLFWAIGFGVLHIVYGTIMYYKYERK